MKNQLFQIAEVGENEYHAGTKATGDEMKIAQKLGFKTVTIRKMGDKDSVFSKIIRQIYYLKDWNTAYKTIPEYAIVLLQHPFHHRQLTREQILKKLRQRKKIRIIAIIHDVEQLREYRFNDYYQAEFNNMLERSDLLIVHNTKMKEWFVQQGIPEQKLIALDIFDYLTDSDYEPKPAQFSQDVFIAGNLDLTRSGYLARLVEINDIQFTVYGPNPDETLLKAPNIHYAGSVPPETLPKMLNKGFGLVWDGNSINGCEGSAGKYLQYNNPHKLSLYLASGLPVIIWKGAAEATLVKKQNVGIIIESIKDLSDAIKKIDQTQYQTMQTNAFKLGSELRNGYYTTKALEQAVEMID